MADLNAALQAAANDAIAEEGGIVTGFVAMVTYIGADGERYWQMAQADEQGIPATLGIAQLILMTVKGHASARLFAFEEDPDEG